MAIDSTCPKCGKKTFEAVPAGPSFDGGSAHVGARLTFIRCAATSCGAVVGVLDEVLATQIAKIAGAIRT